MRHLIHSLGHRRTSALNPLLIVCSVLVSAISSATGAEIATWARCYGGPDGDGGAEVKGTADGGCIVIGNTHSFGAGGKDFWVLKLDSRGNIVWQKTYGGVNDEEGYDVIQTADGGYVALGYTKSFGSGGSDIWLLRLDSDGNIIWQKTYGGIGEDWAGFIQQTRDEGFIIYGTTTSFGAGNWDLWVLKLRQDGEIEWEKTYGGESSDHMGSNNTSKLLYQTKDGGYVIIGTTESFGVGRSIWILKLKTDGSVEWQKVFRIEGLEQSGALQQTIDGGYIIGGTTFSTGNGDFWVLKLSMSGDIEWQRTYGGLSGEALRGLIQANDGGYFIAGNTNSFGAGQTNALLLKVDSEGDIEWQKVYGGKEVESIEGISLAKEGYYITGAAWSFGAGKADVWVLKIDQNGNVDSFGSSVSVPVHTTDISPQVPQFITTNTNAIVKDTHAIVQDTDASVYVIAESLLSGGSTGFTESAYALVGSSDGILKKARFSEGTLEAVEWEVTPWTEGRPVRCIVDDIDNDGAKDIIVGLHGYDYGRGALARISEDGSVAWTKDISTWDGEPFAGFSGIWWLSQPGLYTADVDQDGVKEIIVGLNMDDNPGNAYHSGPGGGVLVLEPDGTERLRYDSPITNGWNGNGPSDVVMADVNLDGIPDAVTMYGGNLYPSEQPWIQVLDLSSVPARVILDFRYNLTGSGMGKVEVGDVDGDGGVEYITAGWWCPVVAFDDDGSVLWQKDFAGGDADRYVLLPDLPGAPDTLLFVGTGAYYNASPMYLYCVDARTGNNIWTFTWTDGTRGVTPAVFGDLDDDGQPEVIGWIHHNKIFCLSAADGSVRWMDSYSVTRPPMSFDINSDGLKEVLFGSDTELIALSPEDGSEILRWDSGAQIGAIAFYRGKVIQQERKVKISLPDTTASPGDTLIVPLNVDDASDVAGAEIVITYDPKVLTALEARTTDLTEGFSIADSVSQGKIAITLAKGKGISEGGGSLVDITFRVTGSPGDTSSLVLKKVELYDEETNPIPAEMEDGRVTVRGLKGDVNRDGAVDVRDAILCLRISAGLSIPSGLNLQYARWAADVDGDEEVTSGDALLILYKVLERLIADPKLVAGAMHEVVVRFGEVEEFGDEATVPVLVEGPAFAGDISLTYDPIEMSLIKVEAGVEGPLMAVNSEVPGKVTVALVNPDGIVGMGGEVLRLRFRIEGGTTDGLTLKGVKLFDWMGRRMSVKLEKELCGLFQNYPNPFNSWTEIRYRLAGAGHVKLGVYDIRGRLVRMLLDGKVSGGHHRLVWDGKDWRGRDVSSGVYLLRMEAGGRSWTRKLVMVR